MSQNIIGNLLLNQYRVEDYIASGGMGTVYKVWDTKRNVYLAMKVLHGEFADDPSVYKRFRREANALKKLAHPNIVPFYGLHRTDTFSFLLEAYIAGPTLKKIIRQRNRQPFAFEEVLSYMKALCAALGYAHVHGVVHCDVKPGNVMIDQGGHIFLTDFGIARHAESTTTTIGTAGTPAYMSPEQIMGKEVTPATDVYSLGVLLFEMLTGQRPFRGDEKNTESAGSTANERTGYAHLHLPPPDPRGFNLGVSEGLAQVVLKALAKTPSARYQNAQEFFEALLATAGVDSSQIRDRVLVPASDPGGGTISPGLDLPTNPRSNTPSHVFTKVPRWMWIAGGVILLILLSAIYLGGEKPLSIAAAFPSRTPTATATIPPTITPLPSATPIPTSTPIPSSTPTETLVPTPTIVPAFDWLTEVNHKAQEVGIFSSMVIDEKGIIHLAYFQEQNDMLWYSTNLKGEWSQEVVRGGVGSGMHLSLALDSKDNPVIGFHFKKTRNNQPRLAFLQWTGSIWSGPFRNAAFDVAHTDISMALDSSDQPHFSFLDEYSFQVVYSQFTAAKGFVNQPLANANPDCKSFPIALDSADNPYLLYQAAEGGLYYATFQDGIWTRKPIDSQSGAGYYSAIAIDRNDVPHVAYYDSGSKVLKYAMLNQGSWSIQVLDDSGDVGEYPDITIDLDGNVHISYYDVQNQDLKYAHGRPEGWNIYTVDHQGNVGEWNSIAVSPQGLPYISYYDAGNEDLKLATAFRR